MVDTLVLRLYNRSEWVPSLFGYQQKRFSLSLYCWVNYPIIVGEFRDVEGFSRLTLTVVCNPLLVWSNGALKHHFCHKSTALYKTFLDCFCISSSLYIFKSRQILACLVTKYHVTISHEIQEPMGLDIAIFTKPKHITAGINQKLQKWIISYTHLLFCLRKYNIFQIRHGNVLFM